MTVNSVPRADDDVGRAHVGALAEAEPDDARAVRPAMGTTRGSSAFSTATSVGEVGDHLGLRLHRLLDAAELAGVREADLQHDADVGPAIRTRRAISPTPGRAHLGDEELGLLGRARAS